MRITVKVKPGSKANIVEKIGDDEYIVRVKAPAKEGRANKAVIEALSGYFKRPKSLIAILHGQAGRKKVVEIS